ncbi:MAG TPA: L-2-hydroxyglutarate oxidase, partial [Pirellulaceae bacterium]|nr:L-2-hydroxyglutarate oxidase [Pirellulaceae bacterium]
MPDADVLIIGGGIVGLATAFRLAQRFPELKVVILEKEAGVGRHQTGHNSGVLHSGIYYKPGTLRAQNCRAGKLAMEEFCREHDVPFEICGKVIVAVDDGELPQLQKIYERGQANGVQCEVIGVERLRELEPHVAGVRAIHVPEAGIVNYQRVCERLAELLVARGGRLVTGARAFAVRNLPGEVVVNSTAGEFTTKWLVTCAGLQSDRVARMTGQSTSSRIVPFRGEYYDLKPEAEHLCRNLIYPVPDPSFPFLGVHFTRMIEGGVECGPNAVLAFAREGYRKQDVNLRDLWDALTFPGFLRLAAKHWRTGLGEMWRSFNKNAFVKALQRLVPAIKPEQLVAARAGVRAQALAPEGQLVDDFL